MQRKPKPYLYKKTFTRDFSLGLLQLWSAGETTDPRQWTKKQQPFLPYVVFWRKNGIVEVYVNQKGIDWCKTELMKTVKSDPRFVGRVARECLSRFTEVKPLLISKKVMSLSELKLFAERVRTFWVWFEALWWLIEALDNRVGFAQELKLLLAIRTKTQNLATDANVVIALSIAKAYPRFRDYVDVITIDEATRNKIPSVSELKRRLNEFVYADQRVLIPGSNTSIEREFNIRFDAPRKTKINTLQGQVAFKGKIRGRVHILLNARQMATFKKGEILVSPMTMPDLLPAMKKAAALVTDEGGIVSHAAIMARELSKPCIIGTKIATQVFKNGDIIEVDANKGIVKKLS